MPSKEQWGDWKDHPCTQAMVRLLKETREDGFIEASYGASDNELLRLGVTLGKLNALTGVINFGFIPEEDEDDR